MFVRLWKALESDRSVQQAGGNCSRGACLPAFLLLKPPCPATSACPPACPPACRAGHPRRVLRLLRQPVSGGAPARLCGARLAAAPGGGAAQRDQLPAAGGLRLDGCCAATACCGSHCGRLPAVAAAAFLLLRLLPLPASADAVHWHIAAPPITASPAPACRPACRCTPRCARWGCPASWSTPRRGNIP